ncbi:hypothetical protein AOLI_G00304880 [Acnodon oligacanthus]
MLAVLASCATREAETALAHALDKKSARTIQPFRTGRECIRGQLRGSERRLSLSALTSEAASARRLFAHPDQALRFPQPRGFTQGDGVNEQMI